MGSARPLVPRVLLAGGFLLAGCGSGEEPARMQGSSVSTATVWFEDVAEQSGVDFVHDFGPRRFWMPELLGPGVGLFDMDGDGDLDLYALQSGDLESSGAQGPGNRLFENQGQGNFLDVTRRAGVGDRSYGMGCAVGDYDGDGHLDLYVTNLGANVLYRNRGDGTFEDVTASTGTGGNEWSTSASFVDFDSDDLLDLFVVNYLDWRSADEEICRTPRGEQTYCNPNRYRGPARDVLLRNRGDGTFQDVSTSQGLAETYGNGLGLVWGRLHGESGVDFYVANDGMPNQLWSGQPGGRLQDRALLTGCALSGDGKAEAGMGVCLEDLDRDGTWDLIVTHLVGETNTFYMGGRRGLRDNTTRTGTASASRPFTSFGVGMQDFDHDGLLDMYVCNGRVTDAIPRFSEAVMLAEPDQVYRGLGGGRLQELKPRGGTGGEVFTVGRAAAFGDIDNDGDVDVVVGNNGGRLRILLNVAPKQGGAMLLHVLEDDGLPAVGAILNLEIDGRSRLRQVQRTYSFCASNDPRVHVGLGSAKAIESVRVTWLDGQQETFGPFEGVTSATLQRGKGRR
jgi:hypothetical protein